MATRYIYTKEDLQNIGAGDANGANWRVAGYDPTWVMNDDYIIMNDIDLEGGNHTPIGINGVTYVRFLGTLDGQGYKIYNGTIYGSYAYCGLFCYLGDGANLGAGSGGYISNLSIELDIETTYSAARTGAICGEETHTEGENGGTNVHVKGNITGTRRTGGLVGYIRGGGFDTCSYEGTVIYTVSGSGEGCGGISGKLTPYTGSICFNKCEVKQGSKLYGTQYVGGIVGYIESTPTAFSAGWQCQIYDCKVEADMYAAEYGIISTSRATGIATGGLYADLVITNSYFKGFLSISSNCEGTGRACGIFYIPESSASTRIAVIDSYAVPTIENNATVVESYGGGFCSSVVITSTATYFDSTINGLSDDIVAIAKTTAQMKSITTFSADWDIVDLADHDGQEATAIWFIEDGKDYPMLWYEWVALPAMSGRVKVGGSWLKSEDAYIKIAGEWKQATALYEKVDGAWLKL